MTRAKRDGTSLVAGTGGTNRRSNYGLVRNENPSTGMQEIYPADQPPNEAHKNRHEGKVNETSARS